MDNVLKYTMIYLAIMVAVTVCVLQSAYYEYNEGEETQTANDYVRITDVEYKAELIDDEENHASKLLVTERLTFDVHAESEDNPFWELWRALPEKVVDGLNVNYKVLSVNQILADGTEVPYTKSPKLYWDDDDYINTERGYGPGKWYHSPGPYSPSHKRYECVLFYVDGLYREKVTFEIQYIMFNPAYRYKDCSELYVTTYSEETIKYLKSYKADFLIAQDDMPSVGNYEAHTYGTNANSFPFTESDTKYPGYHTFSFELDEKDLKFKPYNQYLEFALISFNEDYDKFTENAPRNIYTSDNVLEELRQEHLDYEMEVTKYQTLKVFIFIVCIGGSALILYSAFNIDKKMRRKYNLYTPEMQMDYFREIPSNLDPNFAEALVFCRHKRPRKHEDDGYSAIMLSLVRKGYLELSRINPDRDWRHNNIKIMLKPFKKQIPIYDAVEGELKEVEDTREKLTLTEEYYYNLILRHAHYDEITMSEFQRKITLDYENTNLFLDRLEMSITKIGTNDGYFQKARYKEPKNKLNAKAVRQFVYAIVLLLFVNVCSYYTRLDLAYGGYTILAIANLISGIILTKVAPKYVLLTQYGEDEYVKWRGLYNFLNSETLMNERTVVELPLWEQYLVYATAFGISDKVIKAINIRCPNLNSSQMLNNPYYRSRNFYSSSHYIRSATHTARTSYYNATYSGTSGGFSGSHGYGGGGRGGGGGRRWPLIDKIKTSLIYFKLVF